MKKKEKKLKRGKIEKVEKIIIIIKKNGWTNPVMLAESLQLTLLVFLCPTVQSHPCYLQWLQASPHTDCT